ACMRPQNHSQRHALDRSRLCRRRAAPTKNDTLGIANGRSDRLRLPMKSNAAGFERYGEHLSRVERYIGQHMDERLDREVLAAVAGFSVPHFHRVFTALAGENIASYVRRARLRRAGQTADRRGGYYRGGPGGGL